MTMDLKAMWVLILATLFSGYVSFQGFTEWHSAMAISEVVDAKVIGKHSSSNGTARHRSRDYYLRYSIPAHGPEKVGRTEVSLTQWRNTERDDLFKLHFVADDPKRSMANPHRNREMNYIWGFVSAVCLVLAAMMGCLARFARSII